MIPINPVTVGIFAALIYAIFKKGGGTDAKHRKDGRDRSDRNRPNRTASNGPGNNRTGSVNKGGTDNGNLHENEPDVSSSGPGNHIRGKSDGTSGHGETTGLAVVKEVDDL